MNLGEKEEEEKERMKKEKAKRRKVEPKTVKNYERKIEIGFGMNEKDINERKKYENEKKGE